MRKHRRTIYFSLLNHGHRSTDHGPDCAWRRLLAAVGIAALPLVASSAALGACIVGQSSKRVRPV